MKNALPARFVIRVLALAGWSGKTVTGMVNTDGTRMPGRYPGSRQGDFSNRFFA